MALVYLSFFLPLTSRLVSTYFSIRLAVKFSRDFHCIQQFYFGFAQKKATGNLSRQPAVL